MNKYLIIFLSLALLFSGCTTGELPPGEMLRTPPIERWAIKNVTISSGMSYAVAVLNESVEFQLNTLEVIHANSIFLLVLPGGVEYVSGDFELRESKLILEPVTLESGELKTQYKFIIKGTAEGKHLIEVQAGTKDKLGVNPYWYYEGKIVTLCSAETLEKATELCVKQESKCETPKCVEERLKQTTIKED